MALITRRICDHLANHQDGPVEGSESTYTVNGVTVKLDECDPCRKPFVEAFEALREIGRTEVFERPRRVSSERSRGASPDEPVSCPYCDRPAYPRIGYLFQHVRREHGERLTTWLESTGYVPRTARTH